MSQSIQRIEQEITALKQAIQSTEKEIHEINKSINEAEQHILNDDKVNFWEPKLSSLRQDKSFLLKKEERLEEEALLLGRARLASIESQSGEFGFYDMEKDEESPNANARGRNSTWAGDHISLSDKSQANSNSSSGNTDDVKKVESSPSIMTQVEADRILNNDPNANLQGQNRRPHMGNFKSKAMERENSYNVFGMGGDDDDDEEDISIPKLPNKVTRDVSDVSVSSDSSDKNGKQYSVGKFLHEFFDASETLLLAQNNNGGGGGGGGTNNSRTSSSDGDTLSALSLAASIQKTNQGKGLQPAVSTHDFSVFGAEMYNDSDDEK
jgi:hypothetical protein